MSKTRTDLPNEEQIKSDSWTLANLECSAEGVEVAFNILERYKNILGDDSRNFIIYNTVAAWQENPEEFVDAYAENMAGIQNRLIQEGIVHAMATVRRGDLEIVGTEGRNAVRPSEDYVMDSFNAIRAIKSEQDLPRWQRVVLGVKRFIRNIALRAGADLFSDIDHRGQIEYATVASIAAIVGYQKPKIVPDRTTRLKKSKSNSDLGKTVAKDTPTKPKIRARSKTI